MQYVLTLDSEDHRFDEDACRVLDRSFVATTSGAKGRDPGRSLLYMWGFQKNTAALCWQI